MIMRMTAITRAMYNNEPSLMTEKAPVPKSAGE
jgi:hypothetical protein